METVKAIIAFVIVLVMVGIGAWIFVSICEFFVEVPKQLKRIADALEKRRGEP